MYHFAKRFFDIGFSTIGLIILSPIFLIICLFLILSTKSWPFFLQNRPGKNEIIFRVIKFKSMNEKKALNGKLLPDKERLTKFGAFIRKTSLDEIPQLLNVLKGDMSLIGPRPLLPEYLPLYNSEQKKRHNVKPGITGWAQINGRNQISWKKKFELDVYYVHNISLKLDIKIFFRTFIKLFKREEISAINHVTTSSFNGEN